MLDAAVTEFYHNHQEMVEGDQKSSTFNSSGLHLCTKSKVSSTLPTTEIQLISKHQQNG